MRRNILIIIAILFLISLIIIVVFGRTATIEYDIGDNDIVSINYDQSIIKCEEEIKNGKLKIHISPIKRGNTDIVTVIDNKNPIPEKENNEFKRKVYVHFMNVITLDRFLGPCNGDISIIISFLVSLTITMLYGIRQWIRGMKKNIYEYRNVRLLGLIIFMAIILIWQLVYFVEDLFNDYHMPVYILVSFIKNSSMAFLVYMLPIAFITTVLLMMFSIELIIKEGKTWKNTLGVILGGFVCISTLALMIFTSLGNNVNDVSGIMGIILFLFSVCIAYLECILLGTIIMGIISARHVPKFDKDFIIILGCQIKEDGTLLPLLKSRVDKALEFANTQKEKTGKEIIFVPSGGKGNDEIISEAEAMRNYLLENGINQDHILIEKKSKNTFENIKFSNEIIKDHHDSENIAFSTSNYHVFRVGNIASNQGLYFEGVGAKTKAYYWMNAFIREFAATLVSEKKKHIYTIIVLMILYLIVDLISYFA